jgi:predicted amidohydrolase YtcJ
MKSVSKAGLLIVLFISALVGCERQSDTAPTKESVSATDAGKVLADSVYTNGKIYTVNKAQPWAEAVAIKDGKFLVVGSRAEVKAVTGEGTKVVDLGGRMAMPGMFDVHAHPLGAAEGWANLRISNPTDQDAMLAQIKEYAVGHPELTAIRGESWGLDVFPGDSPRKEPLDAIVSDRPVYLLSQTGHSAWVNSKALEMAGITRDTPITESFIYDTDPETGEPSGTVREFAMGAVEQVLPRTTREVYAPALREVLSEFNAFGFTSLKPAEGERNWLEGATHLESQGGLTMRLFPAWHWRTHYSAAKPEQEDRLIAGWKDFQTDLISPRYVKIFYDGGPDSYTALLLEDYVGRPDFKGQSTRPREELQQTIRQFNADGLGVLVHVLGDGGGRELVDIFTEVRKANGDNGVPLHFSHAWMTRPEDIDRLSRIKDACIDFSPVLAYPAPEIEGSMAPPIGDERYQKFFNVRSAFESGMSVGFGSDWPSALIPDPNGFHQMQSWITRQNPEDPSGTLNADQAITLEQAIRGYTLGGAECLGFGWDEKLGSIKVGKLADFIVLDRNLFETPIAELYKTQVNLTLLGGQVVYDSNKDKVDDLIDEEYFAPGTRYND